VSDTIFTSQGMKKIIVIVLCTFLFDVVVLALAPSAYANEWPMFHHDLQHTGYSTSNAPNTNNILWTFTTGGGISSSPTVVDGKVYIGSDDGHLYCLDAEDGLEYWNTSVGGEIWLSSPTVEQGRVYIGGSSFNCLNANNGDIIWTYPSGLHVSSSPAVVNDRVYVGTWYQGLCCFDADPDDNGDGVINHNPYDEIEDDNDEGFNDSFPAEYDLIWKFETGGLVISSPAIYDGKVYIGSQDKKVYCLNATGNGDGTTEEIWRYSTKGLIQSSPAIAYDEVYIGSNDHKIYCLYANNGTKKWSYSTIGDVKCSPAYYDGKVYACSLGYIGRVYCLDSTTGLPAWDDPFQAGGIISSPAIADGKIYVGSMDNKIYCLDVDYGTKIWEYETGSFIDCSSPAIDGRLYIGSRDNTIYCFGDEGNQPPSKPGKPSGITSGSIGTEYSYSTITTDPDGDQVYYKWDWGDGENSEWLGPYNSGEVISAIHAWSTANDYKVKVKAKDINNSESLWSSILTVIISEQLPEKELAIGVSLTVIEGNPFNVNITEEASGNAVSGADVTFNRETIQTNASGQVTFTAPSVEKVTDYSIIANKDGYPSATAIITVLNIDEDKRPIGFVYGDVYSRSLPLEDVRITITSDGKSWVTNTGEDGEYVLAVLPGIYSVKASKQGYETSIKDATIAENTAVGVDFNLLVSTEPAEEGGGLTDYVIEAQIEDGYVGAEIDAEYVTVTLYADLDVEILGSEKGKITFTVAGEEGTLLVIYINAKDENSVTSTYDDVKIPRTQDVKSFLSSQNTDVSWAILPSEVKNKYVVLLKIPEFSEHTVTISSVISGLVGFIAVIFYIIISAVIFIVFLTPMLTNIIRRRIRFR